MLFRGGGIIGMEKKERERKRKKLTSHALKQELPLLRRTPPCTRQMVNIWEGGGMVAYTTSACWNA